MLCIVNLGKGATEEDLYSLFGLYNTNYLSRKSNLEFIKCEKTGKPRKIGFCHQTNRRTQTLVRIKWFQF